MLGFLSVGILTLLLAGIPVAVTLFLLAFGIDQFYSFFPLTKALGQNLWSVADSFLLIAIPLFVLMGEIIVRAGIAEKAYRAMDHWLSWLPGGLLHANITTSALFSATSGSSVATAATVSSVTLPQGKKLGYDAKLFCGSIAAGGTLGILIPPSINLIVYGFLTETSIPKLFMAGLVPGLGLAALFMLASLLLCVWKPSLGGPRQSASWSTRIKGLSFLLPLLVLFIVIVGSIYLGWATPTEAAAIGVLASSGMVQQVTGLLEAYDLGPFALLMAVIALFIVLGFFIETLSLMVITIPIVTPLIAAAGYDKVWFGIVMILFVELAIITPPVGVNLYIVQASRRGEAFADVIIGTLPYLGAMLVMAALLVAFPQIALWLPSAL